MSIKIAQKVRLLWDEKGTKQLKMSKRPPSDFENGELASAETLAANIRQRMKHLAQVLELLHKIYYENTDLYGDKFLAFVGNEVVREWPWKDFPFLSKNALNILEEIESYSDISGKMPFEVKDKSIKDAFKKLRYEHWTPISFFRDIFHSHPPISEEVYYFLLIKYYRIVWIAREEDDALNIKHRSWRPESTYSDLGIEIIEHEMWGHLDKENT
ncbi:hypothetical protein [Aliiglaciecola litoralis]|uniref:Uncharacterized protein n=1 Tax=Aliiglaciecola litoralis TaxID=582857 RepID=A0ABP3WNX9_9ALTE